MNDPNKILIKRNGTEAVMNFSNFKNGSTVWDLQCYQAYFGIMDINELVLNNILVVGSAKSPIRRDLETQGIKTKITSIDFCCDFDKDASHHHIKDNFYNLSLDMMETLKDLFSEIWSLRALPMYSTNTIDTKLFFAMALLMLAPGGNLRVWPTQNNLCPGLVESINPPYPVDKMKQDVMQVLEHVCKLGFKVMDLGRSNSTWCIAAPAGKGAIINAALKAYIAALKSK